MRARRLPLGLLAPVLVALGACGGGSGDGGAATSERVTVLAASSLTEPIEAIAEAFEAANPGVEVAVSVDGSSVLAAQVVEGAPADVLVTADEDSLAPVIDAGLATGPAATIATNRLVIAVAAGNPLGITGLADLDGATVALCGPTVPCGRYARSAFAAAGLAVPPASEEANVRGVLTRVALGEADAGLVYATDVRADDAVEAVALPEGLIEPARYPATALRGGPAGDLGPAFVAFLTGAEAQGILADAGFGPP